MAQLNTMWSLLTAVSAFGGMAGLLIWKQEAGWLPRGVSIIAAYLLFMAGNAVVGAGTTAFQQSELGIAIVGSVLAICLGGGLAAVGFALQYRRRWAVITTLILGCIRLVSIGANIADMETGFDSLLASPIPLVQIGIWVLTVGAMGYLLIRHSSIMSAHSPRWR